jgi:hypothetical protein
VCPRYAATKPDPVLTSDVGQQVQVSGSITVASVAEPSKCTVRDIKATRFCFVQFDPSSQMSAARLSSKGAAEG